MRSIHLAVAVLLVTGLGSCGEDDDNGDGLPTYEPPSDTTPSEIVPAEVYPTYAVPDDACPAQWYGLDITTDVAAEVEYLDDIVACTNAASNTTYLENHSDIVWTLHNTGVSSGDVEYAPLTDEQRSFIWAADDDNSSAVFAPQTRVSVSLPPTEVEWIADLSLTFGLEAHSYVVDKLEAAGEAIVLAALTKNSLARQAVVACAKAGAAVAAGVNAADDSELDGLLLSGLGVGVAGSKCRAATAKVGYVDIYTGQQAVLAEQIDQLAYDAERLNKVHVRLSYANKAVNSLKLILKFLPRV